jgi:hypothetical protein
VAVPAINPVSDGVGGGAGGARVRWIGGQSILVAG